MIAENKHWLALIVICFLALTLRNFASATDERTFQEASAQVHTDKIEYVRHILISSLTNERKITLLKKIFHAGISPKEVESIWGRPGYFCVNEGTLCLYRSLPGTDISLLLFWNGNNGERTFTFADKQGKEFGFMQTE